jgi:hypothetical protein
LPRTHEQHTENKADGALYGDSTVLCEPIQYKGSIVAVIQCFLDDAEEDIGAVLLYNNDYTHF